MICIKKNSYFAFLLFFNPKIPIPSLQLHQLSCLYIHLFSQQTPKGVHIKKKKKIKHIAGASEFVCLWEREWRTKGPMNCLNYMHRMEERDLIAILKTPIIRYSLIFRTFFFTFPAIHWFVCWKHQRLVWNQLETKLIYTVLLHSSHL